MIEILTPPTVPAVTVVDMKEQLRVNDSYEDALVERAVYAATRRAERELGVFVMRQTVKVTLPLVCGEARLPINPSTHVDSISSVKAIDENGVETTVDISDVVLRRSTAIPTLRAKSSESWPTGTTGVAVTLVVGRELASEVDADLIQLITFYAAWLVESRSPDDSSKTAETAWRWLSSGLRVRVPM